MIYYIGETRLSLYEFQHRHPDEPLPAYVSTVFDLNEKTMTVTWIHSSIPNKGYGTTLMGEVAIAAKLAGVETILLDDMSDRYRKPHNIYTKLGLKYENNEGPEMIGNVNTLLDLLST